MTPDADDFNFPEPDPEPDPAVVFEEVVLTFAFGSEPEPLLGGGGGFRLKRSGKRKRYGLALVLTAYSPDWTRRATVRGTLTLLERRQGVVGLNVRVRSI